MTMVLRLPTLTAANLPALLLLTAATLTASAQMPSNRSAASDGTAWTKTYAIDCGALMKHPCPPSSSGYENEFNGDPRLAPLLKRSLPQRESWWVNGYGGSAPVSNIVQEFIGVPHDLVVDDNRYVTATGCVPHDCLTSGLLWIDTGTQPATVVFVAAVSIQSFKGDAGNHLWLYTSIPINFESLPPDLLTNVARWRTGINAGVQSLVRQHHGFDSQQIALATLVQPNGRMHDFTYDMIFYKQNEPQYPQPGAKP